MVINGQAIINGQGTVNSGLVINGNPPASFVGMLDGYSNIAAAYSLRRLRTDYTGNAMILRRDSDNAELAFGFLANGDLDVAATLSWLAGASGYMTTWYDQSGNSRNLVQATADNQSLFVASGPNSKPTVRFDGTNDRLRVTFANVAAPHHIFSCLKQNTWVSGRYVFDGGNTGQCAAIQFDTSAELAMAAGGLGTQVQFPTTSYSVGTFFFRNVANQYYIRRNGTQPASVAAIVGVANITGVTLGCLGNQSSFANVDISEWILFNVEQSNSPLEANMGAYYGITVA